MRNIVSEKIILQESYNCFLQLHDNESSVASFPPATSAAQRMMLNRSRSTANDPNEESDQSILDDHVARNFPTDTPPVARSPPGVTSARSRISKTSGATRSSRSTGSGGTTKTLLHQSFDSRYLPVNNIMYSRFIIELWDVSENKSLLLILVAF